MAITGKIRQKVRDGSLREMWREAKWMFTYIRRYRAVVGIHILLGILGTALPSSMPAIQAAAVTIAPV